MSWPRCAKAKLTALVCDRCGAVVEAGAGHIPTTCLGWFCPACCPVCNAAAGAQDEALGGCAAR